MIKIGHNERDNPLAPGPSAFCTKNNRKFHTFLCTLTVDKWLLLWYNIRVVEGEGTNPLKKIFKKTFQKPLTNQ